MPADAVASRRLEPKIPLSASGSRCGFIWSSRRVGFVNALAYRLRYFTGIVTYFIYVSVYYFIWKAIYEHSTSIEGFDFAHLLTYIGVGWIIRSFYFNTIDQEIAYQVIGRPAGDGLDQARQPSDGCIWRARPGSRFFASAC